MSLRSDVSPLYTQDQVEALTWLRGYLARQSAQVWESGNLAETLVRFSGLLHSDQYQGLPAAQNMILNAIKALEGAPDSPFAAAFGQLRRAVPNWVWLTGYAVVCLVVAGLAP